MTLWILLNEFSSHHISFWFKTSKRIKIYREHDNLWNQIIPVNYPVCIVYVLSYTESIHVRLYTYVCIYTYMYIGVCMYVCVCMYVYVCAHTHKRLRRDIQWGLEKNHFRGSALSLKFHMLIIPKYSLLC